MHAGSFTKCEPYRVFSFYEEEKSQLHQCSFVLLFKFVIFLVCVGVKVAWEIGGTIACCFAFKVKSLMLKLCFILVRCWSSLSARNNHHGLLILPC